MMFIRFIYESKIISHNGQNFKNRRFTRWKLFQLKFRRTRQKKRLISEKTGARGGSASIYLRSNEEQAATADL